MLIGTAALVCGLFLVYRAYTEEKRIKKAAENALGVMREIMPERTPGLLYEDDPEEMMGVVEISGLSFAGYIEIPEADCAFAVQNEWGSTYAPRMKEGTIRKGTGVIITDTINFERISIGMKVLFTDVDGNEYTFVIDYIGNEQDIVQNAKLILYAEGMTKTIQIACIAG